MKSPIRVDSVSPQTLISSIKHYHYEDEDSLLSKCYTFLRSDVVNIPKDLLKHITFLVYHHSCLSTVDKATLLGQRSLYELQNAEDYTSTISDDGTISATFTVGYLPCSAEFFLANCLSVGLKLGNDPTLLSLDTQEMYFINGTTYEVNELQAFDSSRFVGRENVKRLVSQVRTSFENALFRQSNVVEMREGFSGRMIQHFFNNIGRMNDARYLEIGVYNASSLSATLHSNQLLAVAIDNWDVTYNELILEVKANVMSSMREYVERGQLHIIESNSWHVDMKEITTFFNNERANVYFYDAGHSYHDHVHALTNYITVLENTFIYIVDDWNWVSVRRGTYKAIEILHLEIVYAKEVRTLETCLDWHNGAGIFVLHRSW